MIHIISESSLLAKRSGNHAVVALATALVLILMMSLLAPSTALAEDAQKNIVVHIGQYTNDLHSATMGLGLAGTLQGAGAHVTIFVDREAVRIGRQRPPAVDLRRLRS